MKTITYTICSVLVFIACGNGSAKKDQAETQAQVVQKKYPWTNNYPEADQFDDDMEKDFVRAANEFQKDVKASEALITSRHWVVYKDNNGRPTHRNRIAVVTAEVGGQCFLQHLFFQQDAKGSNYGKTYVSDSYGWKEFDCALKK